MFFKIQVNLQDKDSFTSVLLWILHKGSEKLTVEHLCGEDLDMGLFFNSEASITFVCEVSRYSDSNLIVQKQWPRGAQQKSCSLKVAFNC